MRVTIPDSVERRFGLLECASDDDVYRCTTRVADWAVGTDGNPCSGVLATPTDHLMGQVLHDRRPVDYATVTTEMTIDFHRPFSPGQRLSVFVASTFRNSSGGHTVGWILDARGALVATGRARLLYVPTRDMAAPLAEVRDLPPSATTLEGALGVSHEPSEATSATTMAEPHLWTNEMGSIHGGIWGCLAEMSASTLVRRTAPGLRASSLHVLYLRAGTAASDACVRATVSYLPSAETTND